MIKTAQTPETVEEVQSEPQPQQAQQKPQQSGSPGGGMAAREQGGWIRLEQVISFLESVDQNREGHDVEIAAKSNTAGVHKFEITVKEKPMLNKATNMGQAAARKNVQIRVAMTPEQEEKIVQDEYPSGFLKSMGL